MARRIRVSGRRFGGSAAAGWWRGRRFWWAVGGLLVVAAGVVAWVVWLLPGPEPRERRYRDVTACLLTDGRGVAGPEAAAVWAGMRDASTATLAKVQYLEVDGPQTADNARSYLAGLVLGRCDLVLAVGEAPVGAVARDASRFGGTRFVVVGGGAAGPNVSVVDERSSEGVRAEVSGLVAAVVGASADG